MILRFLFFFFNDTATTEIYTLSLHDALPISLREAPRNERRRLDTPASERTGARGTETARAWRHLRRRSEEHTSELQSRQYLVCRLLLEKKKKKKHNLYITSCYIRTNLRHIFG